MLLFILSHAYITLSRAYIILSHSYITLSRVYITLSRAYITLSRAYIILSHSCITLSRAYITLSCAYITLSHHAFITLSHAKFLSKLLASVQFLGLKTNPPCIVQSFQSGPKLGSNNLEAYWQYPAHKGNFCIVNYALKVHCASFELLLLLDYQHLFYLCTGIRQ